MQISHRITFITVSRPQRRDLNQKLQWFGNSLGLFGLRDKDKSCFRIFIQLLNAAKHNAGMSSDELAYSLRLTRGTVVHHLNRLMESRIVVFDSGKYFLRVNSLENLVDELEKDIERTIGDLKSIAKEIDQGLNL